MPVIPYTASSFAGQYAGTNQGGTVAVSWEKLAWAAVTVGKASGDEYAYGKYSTAERIHRTALIRAYLMGEDNGPIFQAKTYEMADPSEKTSISFYLGMTLAKLFADELFGVDRMLHYAVYRDSYVISTKLGKSRPDLIGRSASGEWFVFESKGRSNERDDGALAKAKAQAEQIKKIGGITPICRIASQSFFSSSGLTFTMHDPKARKSVKQRNLTINPGKFARDYYDPIRELIRSRGASQEIEIAGRRFSTAMIPEADLVLGLAQDYEDAKVGRGAPWSILELELHPQEYIGQDGVLVRLGASWRPEMMRLEPHLRMAR